MYEIPARFAAVDSKRPPGFARKDPLEMPQVCHIQIIGTKSRAGMGIQLAMLEGIPASTTTQMANQDSGSP
jgi:hypothetical protein